MENQILKVSQTPNKMRVNLEWLSFFLLTTASLTLHFLSGFTYAILQNVRWHFIVYNTWPYVIFLLYIDQVNWGRAET